MLLHHINFTCVIRASRCPASERIIYFSDSCVDVLRPRPSLPRSWWEEDQRTGHHDVVAVLAVIVQSINLMAELAPWAKATTLISCFNSPHSIPAMRLSSKLLNRTVVHSSSGHIAKRTNCSFQTDRKINVFPSSDLSQ